jgi:hypothetical protein
MTSWLSEKHACFAVRRCRFCISDRIQAIMPPPVHSSIKQIPDQLHSHFILRRIQGTISYGGGTTCTVLANNDFVQVIHKDSAPTSQTVSITNTKEFMF